MDQQTNWSDLPTEMLAEIVKHLDFKSRMQLRATARFEKKMVESWRMKVDCVFVDAYCNEEQLVWMDDKRFDGSIEKMTSLVCSLIKYTKIGQFHIYARFDGYLATGSIALLEKITENGHFKFPVMCLDHINDEDFQKLIEWSTPGTEVFHFHYPPKQGFERVYQDNSPVMLRASIIQLSDRNFDLSLANTIVDAWLRNDQNVGKKVLWCLGIFNEKDYEIAYVERALPLEERALTTFKDRFSERLVEETAKCVRIRMDDVSKHIVLRILNEEDGSDTDVMAIWEVIPADLLEEHFDKTSGYVLTEC